MTICGYFPCVSEPFLYIKWQAIFHVLVSPSFISSYKQYILPLEIGRQQNPITNLAQMLSLSYPAVMGQRSWVYFFKTLKDHIHGQVWVVGHFVHT